MEEHIEDQDKLMKIGIMTEFPSVSVQSGPALQTKFLYEELSKQGHEVTLMGPNTNDIEPIKAQKVHLYKGIPYPTHPKIKIPIPGNIQVLKKPPNVDIIHSQTNTHMVHYALWLREMWRIPVINTHTIHLPTHSHFILSNNMYKNKLIRKFVYRQAERAEKQFAKLYNKGDCLIVQSKYYIEYWRKRGVTIPIEVVGRPINIEIFNNLETTDPYPINFKKGKRLLVVCRHDREKKIEHLLNIFNNELAQADSELTLTLLGNGREHIRLKEMVKRSKNKNRIYMPGEIKHIQLNKWYRHADIFVYTSLSETFGNVVNEALWCGLPTICLEDNMGISHQVVEGINGYLIRPNERDTDQVFAQRVKELAENKYLREKLSENAVNLSRLNSNPKNIISRFEKIYKKANEHCKENVTTPLVTKQKYKQMYSFYKHIGTWAFYNGLFAISAYASTRIG